MFLAKRSREMIELGERLSTEFHQKMLGKKKEILVEDSRDSNSNLLSGFTDNYLRVLVDVPDSAVNQILQVKLTSLHNDFIYGTC